MSEQRTIKTEAQLREAVRALWAEDSALNWRWKEWQPLNEIERADILLAGHLHVSEAASTPMRYVDREHGVIIVQAGTATSTRARGETNSFNAIAIEPQRIEVRRFAWSLTETVFRRESSELFVRTEGIGWKRAP